MNSISTRYFPILPRLNSFFHCSRRRLNVAAPREAIKHSIEEFFPNVPQSEVLNYRFGECRQRDIKIILSAANVAQKVIPDNQLAQFVKISDLIDYLSIPVHAPKVKGIPSLELFSGSPMPQNVTLSNYRKRRWNKELWSIFLQRALSNTKSPLPNSTVRSKIDPLLRNNRKFLFSKKQSNLETRAV